MSTLSKNIKNTVYIGLTATLLTACGAGFKGNKYNTANGEKIILGSENPVCQTGNAVHEGLLIDEKSGKGIDNVEVNIGGCITYTKQDGSYKLSNLKSISRVPIIFEKRGYYKNSAIISIEKKTSNYLKFPLKKNASDWTFKSEEGTSRNNIIISSDTKYKTTKGENYTNDITALYTQYSISTQNRDKLPGDYHGLDSNGVIVNFVSYALMVLDLKDEDGKSLNVSEPIRLIVKNISTTNEDMIPLWNYNYNKGIWVEDGFAQKDENGDYVCEISHPGTWSLSKPIESEMGLYVGRIVDADDNPMRNVRVQAEGTNWMNKDLTTDENGEFKLYVVPNKEFRLSAYDYKDKYGARYTKAMDAIAAGDVVEEN